ncbi:MAG: glycosyltransferase family 39 protein, partial [Verrucomicrobiota bacterium]|nr:glycosyltransferase family 39 protein [Verrucomicrobiota bacterium]
MTRLPALVHPQAIDDEGVYSIVANEMIDGGRLYVDVVERKPPLLFLTYAAVFEMTGKSNWAALHVAALLWTLATMAGLYVCARQLFNWQTGLIAALLYSIFQPWGTFKNLAFNGELLMNLPLVWAWSIAFGRNWFRWRVELLGAGCLMCLAFLLKQPAALAALPLGLYLLSPVYRLTRGTSWKESVVHAAMLTAGFLATLGLAILLLWRSGILSETFYWVITNHTDLAPFWKKALLHSLSFLGACLPLVVAASLALRGDYWKQKPAERRALILLVAFSAVGTA